MRQSQQLIFGARLRRNSRNGGRLNRRPARVPEQAAVDAAALGVAPADGGDLQLEEEPELGEAAEEAALITVTAKLRVERSAAREVERADEGAGAGCGPARGEILKVEKENKVRRRRVAT